MKAKQFRIASRLAAVVFATILAVGFTACGSDDDNPSIDDILSEKTALVTFELAQGDYYVFDYSGSHYIGSDSIHMGKTGNYELNLRQGKHHLVWISLGKEQSEAFRQWTGFGIPGIEVPVFGTLKREILSTADRQDLAYGVLDIEAYPYQLPTQKVEFENVTASLKIEATDKLPYEPSGSTPHLFQGNSGSAGPGLYYTAYVFGIGMFTGFRPVKSISTDSGSCDLGGESRGITIGSGVITINASPEFIYTYDAFSPKVITLCPKEGLNDIQLKAEITERGGQTVPTTTLPKFSLYRGCTTTLRGPLFSGSADDWTVTVEPYDK